MTQQLELTPSETLKGELASFAGETTKFFFGFNGTKETPKIQTESQYYPRRIGEAFHIFTDSKGDFALICSYRFREMMGDAAVIAVIPVNREKTDKFSSKSSLFTAILMKGASEDSNSPPDNIGIRFNSLPFQNGEIIHAHGDIKQQMDLIARAKTALLQKPSQFDYLKEEDQGQLRQS
jgi:hypothetical protein